MPKEEKTNGKLSSAIHILETEGFGTLKPGTLQKMLNEDRLSAKKIYRAMSEFNYTWEEKDKQWRRLLPAWYYLEVMRQQAKRKKKP